jgi:hypothetical protein
MHKVLSVFRVSRALAEVKASIYKDSEARLSDAEAIEALVLCWRSGNRLDILDMLAKRKWKEQDLISDNEAYPTFVY